MQVDDYEMEGLHVSGKEHLGVGLLELLYTSIQYLSDAITHCSHLYLQKLNAYPTDSLVVSYE